MPTRVEAGEIYCDQMFLGGKTVVFENVRGEKVNKSSCIKSVWCYYSDESSPSSSSIGKNSDISEDLCGKSGDCEEVQSMYSGSTDDVDASEEILPLRRSISRFYTGKSKSFTNLADASRSSSIKEIAKPNNAYTRKRKETCNNIDWDNKSTRSSPLRGNISGGRGVIPKGPSRTSSALAVATNGRFERDNRTLWRILPH